ncbi:DUF397 domain-containing protein [Streptomyces sp. NBC_00878]|uniref:DUF397 domain-containing protein n=1 Tax=Streptomyces sp. NBC_00878 TaxID=2975854 RepID=UPI00224EA604|nr:DUF397 domain-containing protein [Streptomyces sp. NBC_00878]MCX4906162.1 DUF397 domain-containing protein [Streptomyces sp. NBC_00878]
MKPSEHTIPDASVLPAWRKSTHSGGSSGECLEVTDPTAYATWRKSTHSGGSSDSCLEVNDSALPARVPVRDSKNPAGPAITFSTPAWAAFVTSLGRTRP